MREYLSEATAKVEERPGDREDVTGWSLFIPHGGLEVVFSTCPCLLLLSHVSLVDKKAMAAGQLDDKLGMSSTAAAAPSYLGTIAAECSRRWLPRQQKKPSRRLRP
jgi:hypothetical protein